MVNFDADGDLLTLFTDGSLGFKHANVAGISIIPDFRLKGTAKTAANMVAGETVIEKAKRARSVQGRKHRDELYLINGHTRYEDANDPPISTIAYSIMDELERVLDLNSLTAANGYLYEIIESIPSGSNANLKFTWIIEATRINVRSDGT